VPSFVAPVSCHLDDGFYGTEAPKGQVSGRVDAGTLESGGDIQATTKVVDCRSLKSSPPNFQRVWKLVWPAHANVNSDGGILENQGLLSSITGAAKRAIAEIREQNTSLNRKNFF